MIAPWNFPLAIPTGMVDRRAGHRQHVVFKPAEQTPGIARGWWRSCSRPASRPACWRSCPASARRSGPRLVEHPDVAFVAFTGSKAVGLEIIQRAADVATGQRHVKRVIAEMGGKNADHRRRRRRPRRGRPGDRAERVRLRGPEVLGRVARRSPSDAVYDALVERLAGAVGS